VDRIRHRRLRFESAFAFSGEAARFQPKSIESHEIDDRYLCRPGCACMIGLSREYRSYQKQLNPPWELTSVIRACGHSISLIMRIRRSGAERPRLGLAYAASFRVPGPNRRERNFLTRSAIVLLAVDGNILLEVRRPGIELQKPALAGFSAVIRD
jgi:hypothetical protein